MKYSASLISLLLASCVATDPTAEPDVGDDEAAADTAAILASAHVDEAIDSCDWFGMRCPEDEPIFTGPACSSDAACGDAACVEGHCFAGVASPEVDAILAGLTGTEVVGGNHARVVVDNAVAREIWRTLIDGGQQSINVSSLLIEDNPIGLDIAQRLAAAARRGVEVRVMVDSYNQHDERFAILTELAEAGAKVLSFNPLRGWLGTRWDTEVSVNKRTHEKLLVVDGRIGIIGGRNIGASYMGDARWRDSDIVVEGPAIAKMQRLLLSDWDEWSSFEVEAGCPQQRRYGLYCPAGDPPVVTEPRYYPPLAPAGTDELRIIHSNPRLQDPSDGYQTYIALIRGARRSIKVTNAYFVPPYRLRRALKAAAARGVDVTVISNSKTSNDQTFMWYAAANFFEELITDGVDLREWTFNTETVHAKTMIVDDQLAVIGSYNLDPRSAASNSEALAVVRGPAVADLAAAWERDLARTGPVSYDFGWLEWLRIKAQRIIEPFM